MLTTRLSSRGPANVAKTVPFKLIAPANIAFEGDVELVIAVGTEGEEGILPSHAPFLTALKPGILRVNAAGGERLEFAVSEGFLQALPDRVVVIVDAALKRGEIDIEKAQNDLRAGETALCAAPPQSAQAARAQAVVEYARARLALT